MSSDTGNNNRNVFGRYFRLPPSTTSQNGVNQVRKVPSLSKLPTGSSFTPRTASENQSNGKTGGDSSNPHAALAQKYTRTSDATTGSDSGYHRVVVGGTSSTGSGINVDKLLDRQILAGLHQREANRANVLPKTYSRDSLMSDDASSSSSIAAISTSDSALVSSLVQRLSKVEGDLVTAKSLLKSKNAEVATLRSEVSELRDLCTQPDLLQELEELRHSSQQQQRELHDMHQFLSDYGLTWVGVEATYAQDVEQTADTSSQPVPDLDKIRHQVRELNQVAGADVVIGSQQESSGSHIHRVKVADPIQLRFYSNGFTCQGIFRSYTKQVNRAFVQDLMEGFFPTEFRTTYPEGVPFHIDDRSNDKVAFVPDSNVHHTNKEHTVDDVISRLPEKVIRNGQVIHVRAGIRDFVAKQSGGSNGSGADSGQKKDTGGGGGGGGAVVIATHVPDAPPPDSATATSSDAICNVKVRIGSESARTDVVTVTLRLLESDTVAVLCHYLDAFFESTQQPVPAYDLLTQYPSRVLSPTETMRSAGLLPHGLLHLQRKKPADTSSSSK